MSDQWTDRLSEYLDGELDQEERRRLEAHLADCAVCAEVLVELRGVADAARALSDTEPSHDLWPGVAARIRSAATGEHAAAARRTQRWRVTLSVPQLLAAAVAFLVVGASASLMVGPQEDTVPVAVVSDDLGDDAMLPVGFSAGGPEYESVIAELQHALDAHRKELDSITVRIVEDNLAVIDRAIDEARAALSDDPSDRFLNAHLADVKRRKLEMLTSAVALANASSS